MFDAWYSVLGPFWTLFVALSVFLMVVSWWRNGLECSCSLKLLPLQKPAVGRLDLCSEGRTWCHGVLVRLWIKFTLEHPFKSAARGDCSVPSGGGNPPSVSSFSCSYTVCAAYTMCYFIYFILFFTFECCILLLLFVFILGYLYRQREYG